MTTISLLTDPGLTDSKLHIITPTPDDYWLRGPYGILGDHARWAMLTDGIGMMHQMDTHIVPSDIRGGWLMCNDIESAVIQAKKRTQGTQTRTRYTLTLDTRNEEYGCDETDLLLCAIGPVPNLIREPGIISMDEQPSLAEMQSLTCSWWESLFSSKTGQRCKPGYDMSILMGSIYVKNTETGQVLQYEVVTYDSRDMRFNASLFVNTGTFVGIADSVHVYREIPYLDKGESRVVSVDLLPRLRAFLTAGSARSMIAWQPSYKSPTVTRALTIAAPQFDPDLAHWKVLMASWGPFVNGSARVVSQLENIQLKAEV